MKSAYTKLLNGAILPIGDRLTQHRVMSLYRFYAEAQWWNREKLIECQNARLRETIRTVYQEVPFYQKLYDASGIDINSIRTSRDLELVPIVTKSALKAGYPAECTRRTNWPWKEFFTSGSSGQPFAVRVDNLTLSHARALMLLRASFSGWHIGVPSLQTGMSLKRGLVRSLKDLFLKVSYVSAFDLSDTRLDLYLDIIRAKRLKYVMGYPGSIYYLARRARQVGFDWALDGVVTWGDNVYDHYRQAIESAFGCRVTDTYGCGEGIQVAAQCGHSNGAYHIFMPHVIVEVLDDNGIPVNGGNSGHIVLTRLDPGAMPLIRYKVGDMGALSVTDHCPCGRALEMLSSIDGRDTDAVITPSGNRLIVHFFTGIFEYYPSIENFFVFQDKSGLLSIEIVPSEDFSMKDWESIKGEILEKGDADLQINMKIVKQTSNPTAGKRRFVRSEYLRT